MPENRETRADARRYVPRHRAPRRARRGFVLSAVTGAVTAAVVLPAVVSSPSAAPAAPGDSHVARANPLVVPVVAPVVTPAPAGQVITVTATSTRTTKAIVQRWERRAGAWQRVGAPVVAEVGAAGLSRHPSERLAATPIGTFTITQAFGGLPNTGHRVTQLPYFQSKPGYSWGSDPRDRATYNKLYNCHCDQGELYNLRGSYFRYGLVIDYNRDPIVRGAGSGFFVHVRDGHPTAGCVALPAPDLRRMLSWLQPQAHPRITIRIGSDPAAPPPPPAPSV